jgi:hypothetical protein
MTFGASQCVAFTFFGTTYRVIRSGTIFVMTINVIGIVFVRVSWRTMEAVALTLLNAASVHVVDTAGRIRAERQLGIMGMNEVVGAAIRIAESFIVAACAPVRIVANVAAA